MDYLSYISSWFSYDTQTQLDHVVPGAARNMTYESIKDLPESMVSLTTTDLATIISNLKHVETKNSCNFYTHPLIKELHNVFEERNIIF